MAVCRKSCQVVTWLPPVRRTSPMIGAIQERSDSLGFPATCISGQQPPATGAAAASGRRYDRHRDGREHEGAQDGCHRAEPVTQDQVEDQQGRKDRQPDHQSELVFGGRTEPRAWRGADSGGRWVVMLTPLGVRLRGTVKSESVVEVADRVADVFLDQVGVHSDGGRGAGARGGDDLGAWVDDVAGRPDAGNAGAAGGSTVTQPSASTSQPRPTSRALFGTKRGGTNNASTGMTQP